jgi:hypothetical protein
MTQFLGVCYVAHTSFFDIGEHSLKPFPVEPRLKIKVFDKVLEHLSRELTQPLWRFPSQYPIPSPTSAASG